MNLKKKYLKISILIIFYNEAKKLRKTIESLYKQTYPKKWYEVIGVDDGSTDNSVIIAENLGVKVVKVEHSGISVARNLGLKHCNGNIILFIDAHLYLKKNVLSLINKTFQNYPKISGVCGQYFVKDDYDKNYIRDIRRFAVFDKNECTRIISLNNFTTFSSAIGAIKKNVFNKVIYPVEFNNSYGEDVFFQLRAHNNGHTFLYNPNIRGVHDAEICSSTLLKKMMTEIRSMGNILYYSSLINKSRPIPYLNYFLSYPLLLMTTLILSTIYPKLLFVLATIFFIEIRCAMKCFKIKKIKFIRKMETVIYLMGKEIIQGFYIPFYLLVNKRSSFWQMLFFAKTVGNWEIKKLKLFVEWSIFIKKPVV